MRKFYGYLALAALVVLLDQASKLWVLTHFAPYESRYFLPFFNWVLVFNPGASFSFLSNEGGWQRYFLSALALLVSVWIVFMLKKEADKPKTALAFALILGGALGNVIDRIRLGAVVDFIDWHYAGHHWPAFNLADSAIFLGVLVMLLDLLFASKKNAQK